MDRRTFIGVILAASAAPQFALSQERRRIAIVDASDPVSAINKNTHPHYSALIAGLEDLGWIEGRNLTIERYSANGDGSQYGLLAEMIVRAAPELIFASNQLVVALRAETEAIPIVSAQITQRIIRDLTAGLAQPGSNVTGVSHQSGPDLRAKRLQLLLDAVPTATRIGYLLWEGAWGLPSPLAALEAAEQMGIEIVPLLHPTTVDEDFYRGVFAFLGDNPIDALMVTGGIQNTGFKEAIVRLSEGARLPTMYDRAEFVEIGGLIAYGPNYPDLYRRAAGHIDKILRGANPGELPIEQPTEFDLINNLRTARALGIEIPPQLLIQATELIE